MGSMPPTGCLACRLVVYLANKLCVIIPFIYAYILFGNMWIMLATYPIVEVGAIKKSKLHFKTKSLTIHTLAN